MSIGSTTLYILGAIIPALLGFVSLVLSFYNRDSNKTATVLIIGSWLLYIVAVSIGATGTIDAHAHHVVVNAPLFGWGLTIAIVDFAVTTWVSCTILKDLHNRRMTVDTSALSVPQLGLVGRKAN